MKKITLDDLRIHVSGNFLCENLPENFGDMEDEEFDEFIKDNAWAPLEYEDPSDIWGYIDDAALALKNFLKTKGIKVEGN